MVNEAPSLEEPASPKGPPPLRARPLASRAAARGVLVAVLALSGPVLAYILPGTSILRRLTERREDLQMGTLRVDGAATLYGGAATQLQAAWGLPAESAEVQVTTALLVKVPGRCRLELSTPEGKRLAHMQSFANKRFEGGEVPALAVLLEQLCSLFASRAAASDATASLERHLRALGVKVEVESLGRFGGAVTYVLGTPADGNPQFWVYKDSFQPARLRVVDAQGGAWDIQLRDYSSAASGAYFPRIVEAHYNGALIFKVAALRAVTKVPAADKLF